MVLTSPRREKQRSALAMAAVSSGGCSGSGKVVPAILLASREEEKAHELQGLKRNGNNRLQGVSLTGTAWPRRELHGGGSCRSWGRRRGAGDWAG